MINWLKGKLSALGRAYRSCLALNARSAGQHAHDPSEATERLVVQIDHTGSLKSNRVSFQEIVEQVVSPLDVAPVGSGRPHSSFVADFTPDDAGEINPPKKEDDLAPIYTANDGELVADPDSIEPGVHQQHDLPAREPRRKAVLIGILYATDDDWETLDTPYEDVQKMKAFLLQNGYPENYINILSDCKGAEKMGLAIPTLEAIREALGWLIEDAAPGDHLFLHYSGHGHQVAADNFLETDGLDEVIVPLKSSGEYLKDNELHTLLIDPLPIGCRLMTVFDCCHAGTMLDLKYEHELHRNGTPQTTPGGHTNRFKWAITPRKTYPQMANHVKIVKTVKRSSVPETHSSKGMVVPRISEPVLLPGSTIVSVVHVPPNEQTPSSHEPSLLQQQLEPPQIPITMEPTLSMSPIESNRPGDGETAQSKEGFPWLGDRSALAECVDSLDSEFEKAHMLRHASTVQDLREGLNFFTPQNVDGRSHTFSQFNNPPEESAQVISVAACHDHEVVFESHKPATTGGLLTNTFIAFMELDSEKKTLDDMIVFLSHAFVRETKEIHSECRPCIKNCCKKNCKPFATCVAAPVPGQCVYAHCSIPTTPPTPLIATLTEKRRQTLITL